MQKKFGRIGVTKMEKINIELLTLTYGGIISQVIKDSENLDDANEQLDKMGFIIGQRLLDEYLAKSDVKECRSLQDIAENITKQAFPMFLGVTADYEMLPSIEKDSFFLIHMNDNPLNDFVELPEHLQGINYSGIITGAIKGALATIHWIAKCKFLKDQLKGHAKTTIHIEMRRQKLKDED